MVSGVTISGVASTSSTQERTARSSAPPSSARRAANGDRVTREASKRRGAAARAPRG